jgi:hypothetical protein
VSPPCTLPGGGPVSTDGCRSAASRQATRRTKNNMQQLLLLLLVTLLQTVEAQSRGPFFGASISGFIISMLVLGSFLLLGIYVCACLKKPAQIEVSQPDA